MADIGVRIAVDGEAAFKKALGDIIAESKMLDSEMKLVSSSFDKNASASKKAAGEQKVLTKQIENQKQKVAMLKQGVIVGGIGLILALVTLLIWRRMEHKEPIKVSGKVVVRVVYAVVAALLLGVGLSLCLVMEKYSLGTVIGLVGIVMLLGLIPMVKGLK